MCVNLLVTLLVLAIFESFNAHFGKFLSPFTIAVAALDSGFENES